MFFSKLLVLIFCIYNVKSQITFAPLSTGTTTVSIRQTTTIVAFGTLSTASTAAPISACPTTLNYCKNGASCSLLNGRDIICTCIVGFTGLLISFFIPNYK
jgi:hypothetical protein